MLKMRSLGGLRQTTPYNPIIPNKTHIMIMQQAAGKNCLCAHTCLSLDLHPQLFLFVSRFESCLQFLGGQKRSWSALHQCVRITDLTGSYPLQYGYGFSPWVFKTFLFSLSRHALAKTQWTRHISQSEVFLMP